MSGFEFNEDMALKLVFQRADDPEPIGVLDFSGPEMTFSGRADESAKAFFDAVIKNQVGWNERQLDVRREVERELAAMRQQRDEAIKQRDEAREEVCKMIARTRRKTGIRGQIVGLDRVTPAEIAAERGWDCFGVKKGGGA